MVIKMPYCNKFYHQLNLAKWQTEGCPVLLRGLDDNKTKWQNPDSLTIFTLRRNGDTVTTDCANIRGVFGALIESEIATERECMESVVDMTR